MLPLTIFLGRFIGLYCIIVALAMMAHKQSAVTTLNALIENPPLLLLVEVLGLAGDERAQFFAELERLATSWASFKSSRSDVKWCHPKLTVEVKHLAGSKTLRHATVRGLAQ